MELKYYRLIKTIAEEGSIANATGKLFLTQSALSHQLRELEERLGFKVFHRKRNQWILTPEGKELYQVANQLFQTIDQGFSNIQQIKEGTKGKINLSIECQSLLPEVPIFLQKMAILYPEIDIHLSIDSKHEILANIQSESLDIALVSQAPISDVLVAKAFFQDEIFVLVHKEHFFNEQTYVEPRHFENAHLIINSFPLEGVAIYEHCLRPLNVSPKKITAIPYTEVTLSMIAANIGVMCAPKWQLKHFRLPDEVRIKPIGPHGIKRKHYLVAKKADLSKQYVNSFIDTFEELFESI
ncbi:MAG: LysR family transcriptional regulator [Bacteroidota bacterium]